MVCLFVPNERLNTDIDIARMFVRAYGKYVTFIYSVSCIFGLILNHLQIKNS